MFSRKAYASDIENAHESKSGKKTIDQKHTNKIVQLSIAELQGTGTATMVPSIIGTDLSITGNVISKGEIQVEGEIQGDIHCSSLIVGEQAQINGGVKAEDVVVRGKVMGSVRGLRVSLQSSSYVEGDIYHQSLSIEQGAFFEGKSRRSDDPLSVPQQNNSAVVTPLKRDASK